MKKILYIAIIAIIFGCNKEKSSYADGDQTSVELAASPTIDSTLNPKIVKTAAMQFRVNDVQKTKEKLSHTIKSLGGKVIEFSLHSNIQNSEKVSYSLDSLKEITSFQTSGVLVAKIPSEKLDDFTNQVARLAIFVNRQDLKMDDQGRAYLANQLKAQNNLAALAQIKQTAQRKSNNVESALYIKNDLVDKKIENLSIDDKVNFSTINLDFYQSNTVKTFIVANDRLQDYKPSFFNRLGLNLLAGWNFFKEILLAMSALWVVFVFVFIVYMLIRYFNKKSKLAMLKLVANSAKNKS